MNGFELFWSIAKLRMVIMRGLRKAHFFDLLLESQWRWNHRRDNLYGVLLKISFFKIAQLVKPDPL